MFGRFSAGTRFCGVAISWFVIAVVTGVIIPHRVLIFISLTPEIFL
ncbi:16S rRNA processing protein RimM [Corynebacterium genitalium]|nr:16S rRNA processing protein RimM [Corynebacterium genitalium]